MLQSIIDKIKFVTQLDLSLHYPPHRHQNILQFPLVVDLLELGTAAVLHFALFSGAFVYAGAENVDGDGGWKEKDEVAGEVESF